MAQQLKEEVRTEILRSAAAVFAERGYAGASVADIASAAGVSTGNVYRYYKNKGALFDDVVPASFVAQFMELVERRVAALGRSPSLLQLDPEAQRLEQELLEFWLSQRAQVVIVLGGAEGTRHAGFAHAFVDQPVELALSKLRAESGGRLRPVVRFTLVELFRNTVRTICAILKERTSDAAAREAFAAFWAYQRGGLASLQNWVVDDA